MMVRDGQHVCHGCQSGGHLKKDCLQAEHPNVEFETAREKEVAAKEIKRTGQTIEVELYFI